MRADRGASTPARMKICCGKARETVEFYVKKRIFLYNRTIFTEKEPLLQMKASEITPHSRVWLEINLDTIERNYRHIQEAVKPLKVLAVLKANAYGLGVEKIAERLDRAGAAGFCVAELKEALPLVKFGKPVQILGAVLDYEIPAAVANHIILGITDVEVAKKISAESVRQNVRTEVQLKVDTGMGRLGILENQVLAVAREVVRLPNLDLKGIYTHFPIAYHGADRYSFAQTARFLAIIEKLSEHGIELEKRHIANSDAINNCPFATVPPFTHVRAGINLHGSFDTEGQRALRLEPVLALKTYLAAVRTLPAGHTIGYGCTCRLFRDTKVGTIAAGYADGLPLNLSNRGYVIVKDRLCPILGRLSMDYTTISLDGFEDGEIAPGEIVTCIGGEGPNRITVEDWAQIKGTHSYDVICSFGTRVERIFVTD